MENARLKILTGLYFNCKEQLNTLKEQVEKNSIEIQLLNDTGAVLLQEIEKTNNGIKKASLSALVNNIPEELKEAHVKANKSVGDRTLPATENKITYLEARLESIKNLLGKENYLEIEKYEKDKILKNK